MWKGWEEPEQIGRVGRKEPQADKCHTWMRGLCPDDSFWLSTLPEHCSLVTLVSIWRALKAENMSLLVSDREVGDL